jgi:hypothetical protein
LSGGSSGVLRSAWMLYQVFGMSFSSRSIFVFFIEFIMCLVGI